MTNLPPEVIKTDKRLQQSADKLMELRWHWTLDKTNPDRVSQRKYASQVGVVHQVISRDASGWADWLAAVQSGSLLGATPGTPQTPGDFRELRKLAGDQQEAAKAVARVTGTSISTVTSHNRDEIQDVVNTARERAVDRGTTVEHEIDRAAEFRAKARKAAKVEKDERKAAHTMRFVEIEGHLGAAMQRLRKILDAAQDVDFTDDERELITDSLGKMRALMNLIDLRIAGETNINWDDELRKLVS